MIQEILANLFWHGTIIILPTLLITQIVFLVLKIKETITWHWGIISIPGVVLCLFLCALYLFLRNINLRF